MEGARNRQPQPTLSIPRHQLCVAEPPSRRGEPVLSLRPGASGIVDDSVRLVSGCDQLPNPVMSRVSLSRPTRGSSLTPCEESLACHCLTGRVSAVPTLATRNLGTDALRRRPLLSVPNRVAVPTVRRRRSSLAAFGTGKARASSPRPTPAAICRSRTACGRAADRRPAWHIRWCSSPRPTTPRENGGYPRTKSRYDTFGHE